jgi:hypothetical protein
MRLGLMMAMVTIVAISLTGLLVFANEKAGPKGSVGGGTPSAGKGVPQMQTPVDPMQKKDAKGGPQKGSGQGTQNPKEDTGNTNPESQSNTEKTKGKK